MTGKPESFDGNCQAITNAYPGRSFDRRGVNRGRIGPLAGHAVFIPCPFRWQSLETLVL